MENKLIKILLVDDESPIADTISAYAKRENMTLTYVNNGQEALDFLKREDFDIVLLDWMLPGISGLDVIKQIREFKPKSAVPILMISARNDEADVVLGLEIGADDYITKPFGPRELIARIHSLLRRAKKGVSFDDGLADLNVDGLYISFKKKLLKKNGSDIDFTPGEFRIIEELCMNRGKVVSRETLMVNALGYRDFMNDRTLDTHIKNIRKKLEDDPQNPRFVKTVRELGFKFVTSLDDEITG